MDITVLNAELCENPNGSQAWVLALDVTDASTGVTTRTAMVVPTDALEWRIAEYELDDLEDDEVWEMILREPFSALPKMDDEAGLALAPTIAEARDVYVGQIRASKGKGQLRRAKKTPTKPAGKGAKVKVEEPEVFERVKAAGNGLTVIVDSDGNDPIELMKKHCPRRAEHVDARRTIVTRERERATVRRTRRGPARDDVILSEARRIKDRKKD